MTILAAGKKIGDAHLIPAPVALTAHLHPPPVRTQPSAVQCPLKRENEEKTPHFQYRVGEKLGHKYKVTRLLGTGTFGRVVEGRYDGRFFAIKVNMRQVR